VQRVADAAADVDLCGQVVDDLGPRPGHHPGQLRPGQVDLGQLDPPGGQRVGQVLPPTGRQVVDHRHLVPVAGQAVDHRRADEAGTARDQRSHAKVTFPRDRSERSS
jgi:hypothetical protein